MSALAPVLPKNDVLAPLRALVQRFTPYHLSSGRCLQLLEKYSPKELDLLYNVVFSILKEEGAIPLRKKRDYVLIVQPPSGKIISCQEIFERRGELCKFIDFDNQKAHIDPESYQQKLDKKSDGYWKKAVEFIANIHLAFALHKGLEIVDESTIATEDALRVIHEWRDYKVTVIHLSGNVLEQKALFPHADQLFFLYKG